MKIYNEQIALQSQKQREVFNITTQVKAAMEKSGLREGIVVAYSQHSNTALVIEEDQGDLLNRLSEWLADLSSDSDRDQGATARFPAALLQRQVVIPFSEGRLDLGGSQAILLLELDGRRPRRVVLKVLGE
jgi:secondary thiamine-phosphate synthase enzyme